MLQPPLKCAARAALGALPPGNSAIPGTVRTGSSRRVSAAARGRQSVFRRAPGFGAQSVDVGEGFTLQTIDVGLVRAAQPYWSSISIVERAFTARPLRANLPRLLSRQYSEASSAASSPFWLSWRGWPHRAAQLKRHRSASTVGLPVDRGRPCPQLRHSSEGALLRKHRLHGIRRRRLPNSGRGFDEPVRTNHSDAHHGGPPFTRSGPRPGEGRAVTRTTSPPGNPRSQPAPSAGVRMH